MSGGREPRGIEGGGCNIPQGWRLVCRSVLVKTLLTNPRNNAPVANGLCGVAFLAQPRSLSPAPGLDQYGLLTFFFRLLQWG